MQNPKLTNAYMNNALKLVELVDKYEHNLVAMCAETGRDYHKTKKKLREIAVLGIVPKTKPPVVESIRPTLTPTAKVEKHLQIRVVPEFSSSTCVPDEVYEKVAKAIIDMIQDGKSVDLFYELTRLRVIIIQAVMNHYKQNITLSAAKMCMNRSTLGEFLSRCNATRKGKRA